MTIRAKNAFQFVLIFLSCKKNTKDYFQAAAAAADVAEVAAEAATVVVLSWQNC